MVSTAIEFAPPLTPPHNPSDESRGDGVPEVVCKNYTKINCYSPIVSNSKHAWSYGVQ